jgi:type I restriction enzyme S subunit
LIKLKTNYLLEFNQGTSIKGFVKSDLETLQIKLPSIPEQKIIASSIAAVDNKLQALKKKKTLLEQYKKGMMQKIFSQELRFKDDNGAAFPKWEKKKLGDICESIVSGKTKPELEGEYFVYGSTGIIGKSLNYTHSGKYLLAARVGANAGQINVANGKFSVTDNTLVIKVKNQINIDFVFYFILEYDLNKLVFGSGQPLITGGQLKLLNINLPCLTEQTKIANFLSAIDDKINLCNVQIEKTEQWKKGLLQKMFV